MVQPHQLAVDIVWDPDPPGATYDAVFASYADESSLGVSTGVDGLAIVPPVYSQPARTAIPNGGHIYKAATRLEVGGAFDAATTTSRLTVTVAGIHSDVLRHLDLLRVE
jgi:hypothetical protein